MLALSFSTLFVKCLMKILVRSAVGHMVGNILGGCLFESVLLFGAVHYWKMPDLLFQCKTYI